MYLLKYILKRIGLLILTFMIIFTMCFVLVKMLPNLPVEQAGKDLELTMIRREMLGYDKPIMEQYWIYLFGRKAYVYQVSSSGEDSTVTEKMVFDRDDLPEGVDYTEKYVGGIIRGYFGVSEILYQGQDVWQVFAMKVPFTVSINLWSILFSIPLGLGLGVFAALKKNKWQDYIISTGVMIFVSVPSFIYAFLVQYVLYFRLGWSSAVADATNGAWSWTFVKSAIPAILSLSFGTIAGFARYTRAELTEVMTCEFMLLARTKGLTRAQATLRHAMRNAMVPIFPMILGEFISIMSGSLIIEQMFTIPGVGQLYISSIQSQPTPDYNIFMLLTGFYTLIGLAAGIVIDISYSIIDPRIRMGAK